MKILINLENTDDFRDIHIEQLDTLETLKFIIEAELGIPSNEQEINFNGKHLLGDMNNISSFNILENDILIISRKKANLSLASVFDETMKKIKENKPLSNNQNLSGFNNFYNENNALVLRAKNEAKNIKHHYSNNPGDLAVLFNTDTKLAEAICGGDDLFLEELIRKRMEITIQNSQKQAQEHMKLMNSDPNDLESQKKIEEIIRLENINENLRMAQEYLPETLSTIHMLYIPIEINKTKLTALVDTGAQSTIMSQECCKKAGLFNMVDTRYHGIAVGVGSSKIIGVIHAAQIKINDK